MRTTISVSVSFVSGSFPWVQLWMMPFMSRYKLSMTGICALSAGWFRRGYRSLSHL